MWMNSLRKCFLTILFVMSPNKFFDITITAFPDKSDDYVNPVINKPVLNPYLSVPAKWTIDVIKREKDSDLNILEDDEPGFDLDDKEMKKFKIWKNGIIPFYIDIYSFDKVLRDMIRGFLDAVNDVTGLRFIELPLPPMDKAMRWVFFLNRRGLLNVEDHPIKEFTNTGVQKVVLGYDSMCTRGELPKAVLALAGVPPQHNSPDRDEFITHIPENIQPDKLSLFEKLKNDEWLFHDVPYDHASASHYDFHQYTINGFATIKPKHCNKPIPKVGEGNGFSHSDILKIRMLYNYISKNISDKKRISDCSELFKTGPNLTKSSNATLIRQPRRKPNKYLGLPEENFISIEKEGDEINNEDNMSNETHNTPQSGRIFPKDFDKKKNQPLKIKLKKYKDSTSSYESIEFFRAVSDYKTDGITS